jgi:hypothetical protein
MAKRQAQRPRLFKNENAPKKVMRNFGDGLVNKTLDSTMKSIKQQEPKNISAERKPKYIKLTEQRMESLGVIDLKPFFAKSGKAKKKADGGWYLRVPIRRTKRSMSRRMYEQLRGFDTQPGESRTVISDYLYDRRKESSSDLLNYTPVSNNITKITGANGRSSYVSFRTVSDKSSANSWIINREKVTEENTSKTFVKNVSRLMNWKMRNT